MCDDLIHIRHQEIKSQLALGTLDINKMSATSFLAIEDYATILAIKPLWIEHRRNTYTGEYGWKMIESAWYNSQDMDTPRHHTIASILKYEKLNAEKDKTWNKTR